jgi:hypothetical protein
MKNILLSVFYGVQGGASRPQAAADRPHPTMAVEKVNGRGAGMGKND